MAIEHGKKVRWVHEPFKYAQNGIEVACDKDGKVTLSKEVGNDEIDEITVPASIILKTGYMLRTARKGIPYDGK